MTDKQSEALRIADLLGKEIHRTVYVDVLHQNAINELRRLHEVNTELVEALKVARNWLVNDEGQIGWNIDRINETLAKAQGDNNK